MTTGGRKLGKKITQRREERGVGAEKRVRVADSESEACVDTPHPGCPVVAFGMPTPTPRHSGKRGWICLITKELTFLNATKRLQAVDGSRVRGVAAGGVWEVCSR
jgi:hypothetical protein